MFIQINYYCVVCRVWSDVCSPLMTSTNFMTGTGFMKCIPITWWGRLVELASSVIEMDEVFEAIIAWGLRTLSNDERTDFFTFAFYTMALFICKIYLNDKVNVLVAELINIVYETNSAVEWWDLFIGDFVFREFLLQPWGYELLWLFQCDLVGVIDCDIQSSDPVCNNGDSCSHLSRSYNTKWLDVTYVMLEY